MTDNREDDVQIRGAVDTLARQVVEDWREKLAALRESIDQQIASIEATVDAPARPVIDGAVKNISEAAAAHARRARQHTQSAASQALAAIEDQWRARIASETETSATLGAALEDTKQALKSSREKAARAEQQVRELTAERAELLQRIASVSAAKAAADAQNRHLEAANQRLSQALSQILRGREVERPAPVHPRAEVPSAPEKRAPKEPVAKDPAPTAPKRPATTLQFSESARDAKRVKIRRGIIVDIDGIPGELVDLSLGGAQAVLRQAVKPNQLVRLMVPTSAGQIVCKGRVVWTVFERPRTSLSVYRTGVKFTDVDAAALENFMKDYCDDSPKHARHSSGVA